MKLFIIILSPLFPLLAFGQNYNLFNPKPDEQLRPIHTDRPDKTESPYTVDGGHYQIEAEVYSLSDNETDSEAENDSNLITNVGLLNLKAGLTDYADLQLIIPTYVEESVKSDGDRERNRGTGDLFVRYKQNLYGNDGGDFAIALMPYIKIPTAKSSLSNEQYEGGLLIPLAFSLPAQWSMGTMLGIDNRYNSEDNTRRTDYYTTWTFSHSIYGKLSGFFEMFTKVSDDKDFKALSSFDLGLTYGLTPRIQLDAGAFIGLTDASEDLVTFFGISVLL